MAAFFSSSERQSLGSSHGWLTLFIVYEFTSLTRRTSLLPSLVHTAALLRWVEEVAEFEARARGRAGLPGGPPVPGEGSEFHSAGEW